MPRDVAGLIEGYHRFRSEDWEKEKAEWETLSKGQKPRVLIIACSDSRVDPTQIFDALGASRDRFTVVSGYDLDGVGLTVTGTWLGQASLDDQFTGARPGSNIAYRVRPQFYLDSQLRFRTADNFEFYVGGFNLLNNKPPFVADIGSDAGQDTYTSAYDPLGRRYYAGFRLSF